jgi:hypothetical protein
MKEPLIGDHIGAWWTRHQVPGVVGQQGRVLLRSATRVGSVRAAVAPGNSNLQNFSNSL